MRKEYDFSKAKRGPVVAVSKGKTRITIRIDDDLLAWFKQQVNVACAARGTSHLRLTSDGRPQPMSD